MEEELRPAEGGIMSERLPGRIFLRGRVWWIDYGFRGKRYRDSTYASLTTCIDELHQAQRLFQKHKIPVVNTAGKSIEETANQVMHELGISKKTLR